MKIKAAAVILLLLLFPCINTYAETPDAYKLSGADKLDDADIITEEEKNGDKDIDFFQKILNVITFGISSNIKGAIKTVGLLSGLIILSSVFKSTVSVSEEKALAVSCDFISIAVFSAALFSAVSPLFKYVSSAVSAVNVYTKALIPVMASLYSLSGCVNSAVSSTVSSYAFLTFTEMISSDFILPLLNAGFAVSLSSSLPGSADISSLCSFIKKAACTALAFIFTFFGFVITVKNTMALSADRLAFRGIKFASGSFIPVIGNVLGDSVKTVFASVGVIRSTVGAVGMISILSLTVPPMIAVLLYKCALSLCSSLAKSVSLTGEAKLLDSMNELLGVLLAIASGVSVVFIIICSMFMKAGVDL